MLMADTFFTAYMLDKPGMHLQVRKYNFPLLKPSEVRVAISHCGVCRSDLHFMQNSWGDAKYPMVPGHEIVGVVTDIGSEVASIKIGQRVGISWQTGACGVCVWCQAHREEFCTKLQGIGISHFGGFASHIDVAADYVYEIPEILNSSEAAPLFCAGATAFNAIKATDVSSGMRVAVLGVGGIGHLCVQFAKAYGAEVIALVNDLTRAAEIKAMGASDVYLSNDFQAYQVLKESCDVIISTLDSHIDYAPFLDMLKPLGSLCFIGIPPENLSFSIFQMVIGQKKILAVPLGGRRHIREMLQFAALHQIKPHIEVMPMSSINEALKLMDEGRAHYRFVMVNHERE